MGDVDLNNDESDIPEFSPLKLIIITCKTHLNCNLNLKLMAKKLVLNQLVIGKKLLNVIEEGIIKTKSKTTHSRKNAKPLRKMSRKDFSNQCTIIVKSNNSDRNINLKIFGNGKIVITGCLSKEEGKFAVLALKERTQNLEDIYQIVPNSHFYDHFNNIASYLKYMGKNYLAFLKIFSLFDINVDLRLDLILNKKFVKTYPDNDIEECDPIKQGVLKCDTVADSDKFIRMIQIFNICHLYFPNEIFIDKLDQPEDPLHLLIKNLFELKPAILPLTFDKENFNKDFDVTIENYNTMFNSGFQNNREIFTQILNDKYKTTGLISSAKFEPSNYQGINVKYISRVLCTPQCISPGKKKNSKCSCKKISFLIFQEGNIIITGGRSWDQLMDGYKVITDILKEEYHNIMVKKSTRQLNHTNDLPSQIIKHSTTTGTKTIYINKKTQITENPRNVFLLKKLGLLDKYLTN